MKFQNRRKFGLQGETEKEKENRALIKRSVVEGKRKERKRGKEKLCGNAVSPWERGCGKKQ